jgi:hypothetical protein
MHTEDEKDSGENRHNRDGFGTPLPSCASSYFTLQQTRCAHATTALQTRAPLFEAFCHGEQTDGRTDGNGRAGGGIRRVYVSACSCREMLKCLWRRVRRVTRLTATLQKGPRSLHFPHAAGDLLSKHPWFLWVHA